MGAKQVIWLGGMPRSGTTWMSQIFAAHPSVRLKLCPLFSYAFKGAVDASSTATQWQDFFDAVYESEDDYMDQVFLRKDGLVPSFAQKDPAPDHLMIKSNRFHTLLEKILALCPQVRFIFIVRDPVASIASWVFNPREFPQQAVLEEQWRSGDCRKTGPGEFWGFDDWKAVTTLHLNLAAHHPQRVRLIEYNTLKQAPEQVTRELLDWLGLGLHAQTRAFIEASQGSHSENPRAVFKTPDQVDRLHSQLPRHIRQQIEDEVTGTALERFLHHRIGAPRAGQADAPIKRDAL